MTTQLTLPNIPTDVRTPWPLGVWLRVYTNSLLDDAPTTIGQLIGYGLYDDQATVKLVNAHGGIEAPIDRVVGVVSPVDARPRTGFPKICPIARAPVLSINCFGCEYRQRDQRGYWRCDHIGYQAASGAHFCLDCGVELGPYAEARGWERCGGPQERCLKAGEKSAG
jgi:hypothetical protein